MSQNKMDSIIAQLRDRIITGEWSEKRITPQRQLCEEMSVSRETMHKAIAQLKAEGMIEARGKALYGMQPRIRMPGLTKRFDLHLAEQGLQPVERDIIRPEIIDLPDQIAQVWLDPPAQAVHRHRLQGSTSRPMRLAENFYRPDLAGGNILEAMQNDTRTDALELIKQQHNRFVVMCEDRFMVRFPTDREIALIKISRATPVIELHRKNYDQRDEILYYNVSIFKANLFEFEYKYPVDHWR